MSNRTIDVSVVFVNYKTSELVKNSIDSVKEKSKGFSYEIIIVDNSQDSGELQRLQLLEDDSTHVIDAKSNLGFGKANNLGATIAKGHYLYFLNADTLLMNNAVFELKAFLDAHSDVGVVGSDLYTKDGRPNHSFYPFEKNLKGERKMDSILTAVKKKITGKRIDFNYSDNPAETKGYVCGASLMIRKGIFDSLGGFDKDIFMYAEETLLCYRVIHECGLKIYNVPASRIIHFEGGSFKGITERHAQVFADGNYLYFLKAYGPEKALKALKYMEGQYFKKAQFCRFINREKRQNFVFLYQAFKEKIQEVRQRR